MAAAAPMPPRRAEARSLRRVPWSDFGQYPHSYFDHLPFCLSPTAYVVVGQILRRTRWGDQVLSRSQGGEDLNRDWLALRQQDFAERLRITENGLRKALDEAVVSGCLVSRRIDKPGRGPNAARLEYACAVEAFPKAKVREVNRSGNPEPGAKADPKGEPVPVPCSAALAATCPLPKLVEVEVAPTLKTKGEVAPYPNTRCGSAGKPTPTAVVVADSSPAIRPRLRGILEGFMVKFGRGPSDAEILEIQGDLGGATDEQFEVAAMGAFQRVKSYRYLRPIARECAQTAEAWNRHHARASASGGDQCESCGQRRVFEGRCSNCGWSPAS